MELWSADRVFVKGRFEQDWGVLVDQSGVIQAIGPRQQLVARAKAVQHYPGQIMMPAFTNPHAHSFHRVFQGIGDFAVRFEELEKLLWPVAEAIDVELFDAVYRVAFAEQALAGISTVGEFHYLHNGNMKEPENSKLTDRIVNIAKEMGLRLTLVYAFFDQGSSQSGRAFIKPLDLSLEIFHELKKKYASNPMVDIIPGIHGLEHTSAEAIEAAHKLAIEYDTKLHIQLAEHAQDLQSAQYQYGTTPLRALEKIGILDSRLVIVNGALLDDDELKMVAECGASMVLCPSASLARGDEFPNTWGILREEIPFAVGSDSIAMNNNYTIPEDIKWLEYSQRSLQKRLDVLCSQSEIDSLWDLGSWQGAEALGARGSQLMPGANADFMLVKLKQPCARPTNNYEENHFINKIIFGWGAQVEVTHLMIQGQMVVKNGLTRLDYSESVQKLSQWSQVFLRTIKKSIIPEE